MGVRRFYLTDALLGRVSMLFALAVPLVPLSIVVVLYIEAEPSVRAFGFFEFVFLKVWNPPAGKFGGAPAVFGTLVSTAIAIAIAVPIAIGIAVFLTEIAPPPLRAPVGVAVELLAAIPSIIYGMWGLFSFAPFVRDKVQPVLHSTLGALPVVGKCFSGYTPGVGLFTASVVLSIMVLPFTSAIARDSFKMVPDILKESAYALGATRWDVIRDVVIPYAKLGVVGGVVLSVGRAIGETMAVTFVMCNQPVIPRSILEPATSITVTLANEFTEADSTLYLSSLFHLALVLLLLSLVVITAGKFLLLRRLER